MPVTQPTGTIEQKVAIYNKTTTSSTGWRAEGARATPGAAAGYHETHMVELIKATQDQIDKFWDEYNKVNDKCEADKSNANRDVLHNVEYEMCRGKDTLKCV